MDQTVVSSNQTGGKKKGSGCLIFGLIAVGGFLALVVLGGAAYFMGFIPGAPQPTAEVAQPTATAESAATEAATQPPAATEAIAATEAPQATATAELKLPSIEPYQVGTGVQYPSLKMLADSSGNVTILPNQPTMLEYTWCADGEPNLNKIMNTVDVTYKIDGQELQLSYFTVYRTEINLEIEPDKKVPAFCNTLSGLVRDWSEGEHTVYISVLATQAYDDGWKQHPQGELTETTYKVHVTPASAPLVWDRCRLFEKAKFEIVYPEWKPEKPLEFYYKFAAGVPGLEKPIDGDSQPWEYKAKIENLESPLCTFQGYEGRLYCKIEDAPSGFSNTLRPMTLSVNGCSWPIYYNPIEIMPFLGK